MVDIIAYLKRLTTESKKNRDAIKALKAGGGSGGSTTRTWKDITSSYIQRNFNDGDFVRITSEKNAPFVSFINGHIVSSTTPSPTISQSEQQHPSSIFNITWTIGTTTINSFLIDISNGNTIYNENNNITKFEILE